MHRDNYLNWEKRLQQLRQQIDDIDSQLQKLMNQRAQLTLDIGEIKKQQEQVLIYRPEREMQILRTIIARNEGPLKNEDLVAIFQILLSACRSLQEPMTIAFLGPLGTFSHAATLKHFGSSVELKSVANISEVFEQVASKHAHYGLVPIENTTEGIVNLSLDELIASELNICGEVVLNIHQHLLVDPEDHTPITKIYSHPQSFAQCRRWLQTHYADADKITASSNAKAAELAKQESGAAAIAGELAASYYGLVSKAQDIEDNPENVTRFWIIGQHQPGRSGHDKTSLLIETTNIPGAFANIMQPFANHDVNITLFESRPQQQHHWHYVFFLDIEGHQTDEKVIKALTELKQKPHLIKILGSYPTALY